jgi:glucokinase
MNYYIGIDLGGTHIKIGLLQEEELVDHQVLNAQPLKGLRSHLQLVDKTIDEMLTKHFISSLQGIGMAFPGLVNPQTKKVISTNNKYDDAPLLDLESYFQEKWNAIFFIDNDARMATVGEWKFGAGKDCNDLVLVMLGTGVGTSVVMEGKLMRGKHFQAGCLGGHFVVNHRGRPCTCGNIGCVEAEAATWNISTLAHDHQHYYRSSLADKNLIDFEAVFAAAKKGDVVATEIKEHCLNVWTSGIVSYIHAYDPERVIVGGGIMNSANDIIPFIREKVKKNAWTPWGEVSVQNAALGDQAAILGVIHCLIRCI